MKPPTFAFLVAAIMLFTGASLQAQNLIKNGDFTAGLSAWTVKSDSPKNTAEALTDAGGKSGKAVRITDGDEKMGISLVQKIPCESGKTYELTFMSKTTSDQKGSPGYAMIQFLDAKGAWLNNPDAPTLTPEEKKLIKKDVCPFAPVGQQGWKDGSVIAVAPPGTVTLLLNLRGGNTGIGTIDVSDVSVIQK
jgi:Carbohydrate binding domain